MRFSLALLSLAACSLAVAEEPAAVSLQVKKLSATKDVQKNWEASWGSYDRDYSRHVVVDIIVRNMRNTEATVTLEVLFVAKPLSGPRRWVFDRSTEELRLDVKQPYHAVKISKQLEASVQNYAALGDKDEYGGRIDGYIVRVLSGGKILKVEANTHPLRRIGYDQNAVEAMIRADAREE